MKQYLIVNDCITIKVKRASLVLRIVLIILILMFFLLPILGIVTALFSGFGLKIGYFIFLGLFGLISFYLIRIFLWNSYGYDELCFNDTQITYYASYKYFKDGRKTVPINENLKLDIRSLGYTDDKTGALILRNEDEIIYCSAKMTEGEVHDLIADVKNILQNKGLDL